jgi:hypothetical protein
MEERRGQYLEIDTEQHKMQEQQQIDQQRHDELLTQQE